MRKLWEYIKPCRGIMLLGLLIKFIGSVAELFLPAILGTIVDDVAPTKDTGAVLLWGVVMLLCAVVALVGNIVANRLSAVSAGRVTFALRRDLFRKMTCLSAKQVDEYTPSSLISRLTSDSYNVNNFVARVQRLGVRAPILLIGGILITLTLDPVLTLVLVASLPFIAIAVLGVTKAGIPLYTRQQARLDDMVETVQENATGVRVIRALSKTDYERQRFEEVNRRLTATERKAGIVTGITNPTTALIMNLGLVAVVVVGAIRLQAGLTQAGDILAFTGYFTTILNAMNGLARIFVMCTKGAASANRIEAVLNAPDTLPLLPPTQAEDTPYYIEFRDVSFSYNGRKPDVEHISFGIRRGETLGIIGATGSGKTTLIQLLLRFYDVDEGCILLEGRDIRTIPTEELRTRFGAAFQNDFIMAATMEENIRFCRDITDEKIRRAAEIACADAVAAAFDDGYAHSITSRGTNISGGQKQRLLIARALAGDPAILLLDDSSSALDYRTDMLVRRHLREQVPQVTSLIIAQRISAIRAAEQIIVMEDGKIIGKGRHGELMDSCEAYREIAENQMGTGGMD